MAPISERPWRYWAVVAGYVFLTNRMDNEKHADEWPEWKKWFWMDNPFTAFLLYQIVIGVVVFDLIADGVAVNFSYV